MAASQMPPIPAINPDEYRWARSETDPDLWQRRACGTEAIVGVEASNMHGENDMFYSATIEFHNTKYTLGDVEIAAPRAWQLLRLEHPEIACSTGYDGQVKCLLQYRAPRNDQEAQQWADRTVLVEASDRAPSAIRDDIMAARKMDGAGNADAATMYIAASVVDKSATIGSESVHFLFHTNHLYFDGIGLRQMACAFFRGLAAQLCKNLASPFERLPWHQSSENLPPPIVELLNADQHISGPSFDDALQDLLGIMMQARNNWGLKPSENGEGIPQTLFHTFSKEVSQSITASVKTVLGPGQTITHLAQAAVLLALVNANPPHGDDVPEKVLYLCPSPINARRLMREPFASGEKQYFPISQCNGAIVYENIRDYVQPPGHESEAKTRELLVKGAKVAQKDYARCLNRPNQAAISIPVMELVATMIHHKSAAATTLVTSPNFSSDGINERYIARDYFRPDNGAEPPLFSIKDVFFSLNQIAPFPSLRLSSFRDRARLSLDYNSGFYSRGDMQGFLNDVARFMVTFAD